MVSKRRNSDLVGTDARGCRVLITAAGRRTSLVRLFQDAVGPGGGFVLAADTDPFAPALLVADASRRLPPVTDDRYADALLDMVVADRVDLVVPTIDPELPVLAWLRPRLEAVGVTALVSDETLVQICGDKLETVRVFSSLGFRVPRTWLPETLPTELRGWLFVKPRRGSGSVDARAVAAGQVREVLSCVEDPVIQELVDAPEVTVDALFGMDGTPVHYVPRLRIRTLGGESIQGRTIDDTRLRPWLLSLMDALRSLGARGPVTIQVFLTDDEPTLSEINPRFGGGFPLTDAAGGHFPRWLVAHLRGEPLDACIGRYEVGLMMTRSFLEHFVREPAW